MDIQTSVKSSSNDVDSLRRWNSQNYKRYDYSQVPDPGPKRDRAERRVMIIKEDNLPKGWELARIGDPNVASMDMGQSPPGTTYNMEEKGLPFFQGKMDFGDLSPVPRVWCTAPKKIAQPGDILLSVRAPVGPTNIANRQCCIGRGLAAIRGAKKALTLYLYFWFKRIEPWLNEQGQGSTFKAIGKDMIGDIVFPLPPLPVQERIVQILQKSDEIRRKQQDGVKLANTVLPTIFYHTFGDPATNPKGWPKEPLRNVVTFDTYHVIPEPGETYMYLAP
jgi:type I restriction enzyme S subunit